MESHEVIVPIMIFACVAGIMIVWMLNRHKERLTMIEKGLSSEEIKALYTRNPFSVRVNPLASLKWGILFVLGGIALMLGNYLHMNYNVDEGAVFGLVMLFVGIGLVLFYTIAVKKVGGQQV